MRGWALLDDYPVGRSPDWHELGLNQALARDPRAVDIIALAPTATGKLREGVARVASAEPMGSGWRLRFAEPLYCSIPTATGYDAVFVATAIGEHAFEAQS